MLFKGMIKIFADCGWSFIGFTPLTAEIAFTRLELWISRRVGAPVTGICSVLQASHREGRSNVSNL